MSNEKFTQGEWAVSIEQIAPTSNKTGYAVYTESFDVVSPMLGIRNVFDAHLIAAAPVMYRALRDALFILESYVVQIEGEWGCGRSLEKIEADGDLPDEILAIRAALAKADGEV